MITADDAALIEAAREGRARAYASYSQFAVGAAVRTASGQIFHGCNIENAAYPATCCAERVAIFSAYAAGQRDIVALAVVADTPGPVSPCGSCRQVIFELAHDARIILANMGDAAVATTPEALLPGGFTPQDLHEGRG
ncbi:cytidine deaminase [Chloroflexia bacterium SDU3-3]|nr:cytidine deaminase [Chloroflexia bacterium SDU3-3]